MNSISDLVLDLVVRPVAWFVRSLLDAIADVLDEAWKRRKARRQESKRREQARAS